MYCLTPFERTANSSNLFSLKNGVKKNTTFTLKEIESSFDNSLTFLLSDTATGESIELEFCKDCEHSLVDTSYCDNCDDLAEDSFNSWQG